MSVALVSLLNLVCVQLTTTILKGLGSAPAPSTLCQEVVNHLDNLRAEIRNSTPEQIEALAFSLTLHRTVTNPFIVRIIHEKVMMPIKTMDGLTKYTILMLKSIRIWCR